VEVDAVGRQLRVLREKEPQPGRNLVLTVDTNIQAAAERAVARGIRAARREGNYGSRAGAAVVMDVRNGEVLALASVPTFDPRQFIGGISEKEWKKLNAANLHPLSNRATNGLYPPGSTFKVVTGIAALETGLASMGSNFYCSGSWNKLGDRWSKACWNKSGHRGVTLAQGLVVSCDSVFYDLGLRLHQSGGSFQDWARRFGLGKKTGIDLPAEAVGRVPDAEWKKNWNRNRPKIEQRWYGGDTVNMAIGQGDMLTTPLQMASVYASIANGGQVVRPHLLKEVLTAKGNLEKTVEPELKSLGVPADKVLAVQDSLRNVVRVGTARDAFAGFPVATSGKTGTAEVKGKGDFAWFVGYAPSENPKYAVSVVIEEGGHGGAIAAPVVRNILDAIFSTSSPAPEDINDKSR
ncbi:MAG: penicillin-binding transpeptidase domain-containing protein, partial [Terriglobia bacterium]